MPSLSLHVAYPKALSVDCGISFIVVYYTSQDRPLILCTYAWAFQADVWDIGRLCWRSNSNQLDANVRRTLNRRSRCVWERVPFFLVPHRYLVSSDDTYNCRYRTPYIGVSIPPPKVTVLPSASKFYLEEENFKVVGKNRIHTLYPNGARLCSCEITQEVLKDAYSLCS